MLSAQPAVASDSDSDDDFVDPTPVAIARRQSRDAAYKAETKRKAEKKEKAEKKAKEENKEKEQGKKKRKKEEKPNITEDAAARQGLKWRAQRAVDNEYTTWVWGDDCPEEIIISEPEFAQPMPEMDEERTFDTLR